MQGKQSWLSEAERGPLLWEEWSWRVSFWAEQVENRRQQLNNTNSLTYLLRNGESYFMAVKLYMDTEPHITCYSNAR